MSLQEETKKTLQKVGISITTFCRRMQISTVAYYRWIHDDLKLSALKEQTIRKYICRLADLF